MLGESFSGGGGGGSVDDSMFCTADNVEQGIKYVNAALDSFGVGSPQRPLRLVGAAAAEPDEVARTVNCFYALLQQRKRDAEFREQAAIEKRRMQQDCDQLRVMQAKLREQTEQLERDLVAQRAKESKLTASFKAEKEKLTSELAEITKRANMLEHRDTQYQHELRKKEQNYDKLKDRLNKLLMEKTRDVKNGMQTLYLLKENAKANSPLSRPGTKSQDEMYAMLVERYESKQQQLIQENSELRASFQELQGELQQLLNLNSQLAHRRPPPQRLASPATERKASEQISEQQFKLPFEMVKGAIESTLWAKARLVRARLESLDAAAAGDSGAGPTVEQLQAQLAEYRRLIEQQEQLLQMSLQVQPAQGSSGALDESTLELNSQNLAEAKTNLEAQRSDLEADRVRLAEALLQLGQDRLRLQREREEFQQTRLAAQASVPDFPWATPAKGASAAAAVSRTTPWTARAYSSPVIATTPAARMATPVGADGRTRSARKLWQLPTSSEQFVLSDLSFRNAAADDDDDGHAEPNDDGPVGRSSLYPRGDDAPFATAIASDSVNLFMSPIPLRSSNV